MENNAATINRELEKKLLDFQFRLIEKRYGRLAVKFARFFSRGELTKERLAWIEVFLIIFHSVEMTIDFWAILLLKFRKSLPMLFDNLFLREICIFIVRGAIFFLVLILISALVPSGEGYVIPVLLVALLHFFGSVYKYRQRPYKIIYLLLGQCIWISLFAIYLGWTFP